MLHIDAPKLRLHVLKFALQTGRSISICLSIVKPGRVWLCLLLFQKCILFTFEREKETKKLQPVPFSYGKTTQRINDANTHAIAEGGAGKLHNYVLDFIPVCRLEDGLSLSHIRCRWFSNGIGSELWGSSRLSTHTSALQAINKLWLEWIVNLPNRASK